MFKYLMMTFVLFVAPPTYADEDAYLKLALETTSIPKGEKLDKIVQSLVEAQIRVNPSIRPIRNAFTTFYTEILTSDEYHYAVARIRMEMFTYDELLQLKELMKTPVWVKLEELRPQIMQKSMELSNQMVIKNQERLNELIRKEQNHIE